MTRWQKKFLYGLFYIIIFGLIIWVFIPSPSIPAPVCSDPSCGTNQPLPLRVSGVPQMFKSESTHRVVVLGQVTNPNPDYGAYVFSYNFIIFNHDGRTIISVPGSGKIYPSETKYILSVYDAGNMDLSLVAERPGFEVKNASFRPAAEFLKPNLILTSKPETNVSSLGIKVTGRVKNQNASPVGGIRVISVLQDTYGDSVFAAQTLIQGLNSFEEAPFEVNFPADPAVVQKIDPVKTSVLLSEN
jgi:hypothetical protein